jgi:hypothetical protein
MRNRKVKNQNKVTVAAILLALAVGISPFIMKTGLAQTADGFQVAVDGKGNIHMPAVDYRKDWVALGSWAIAAKAGVPGSQGIHAVYTQPETVVAYRKTGKFPDGAILIKELFSTTTASMTTGTVSRADKTMGWFVMIKDSTNRYPNHKLWGDGWGWAYFDAKDRMKTKSTDYVADCKGCHVPVQKSDWIYVLGYPVLRGK